MTAIEVGFETWKALTARLESEKDTYEEVIRRLIQLPARITPPTTTAQNGTSVGWTTKGVDFPYGTEFRCQHLGKTHYASVENGGLMLNGEKVTSVSLAAHKITNASANGWTFWSCRFPGEENWQLIGGLRRKH